MMSSAPSAIAWLAASRAPSGVPRSSLTRMVTSGFWNSRQGQFGGVAQALRHDGALAGPDSGRISATRTEPLPIVCRRPGRRDGRSRLPTARPAGRRLPEPMQPASASGTRITAAGRPKARRTGERAMLAPKCRGPEPGAGRSACIQNSIVLWQAKSKRCFQAATPASVPAAAYATVRRDGAENRQSHAAPRARRASGGVFTAFGLAAEAEPLTPGLYVVATPIGNLKDVSFRALSVLAAADAVLAEDTRVTKTLLAHYGITTPLVAYHEHSNEAVRERMIHRHPGGPGAGARLRCGHAARVRPRLQARPGGDRRGPAGDADSRAFGDPHRARRLGPADRPLLLRGLPAAEERGAAGAACRRSPPFPAR